MYKGANRDYKMTGAPLNLTDEQHFRSHRTDGRHTSTLAALMEWMRQRPGDLNLPERLDTETFAAWQAQVKERARLLLNLPQPTPQPEPVLLSSVQRDGYRVEKWEYYPDDYTAVPFLALIPDGADGQHPVPGVMCMLGSNHTKEFAAAEPELSDHPNLDEGDLHYPERNRMALYVVKNGMAAFAFENPGIAETSVLTDAAIGMSDMYTRQVLCNQLLNDGLPYVGLTVFHRLQFMDQFLLRQDYVDKERIGIASHSLGTEGAIFLGLLRDEIRAIVFNEDLHDDRHRFMCITEHPGQRMFQNYGNWHIVPGQFLSFGYQDMCAAFAPRYLSMNEGGADGFMKTIIRAYEFCGASDCLTFNYYADYADPAKRQMKVDVPQRGLSSGEFYRKYMYVTVSDHSFRQESALRLLRRAFGMDEDAVVVTEWK